MNEFDDRDAWGPYDTPESMHPESEYQDDLQAEFEAMYEYEEYAE